MKAKTYKRTHYTNLYVKRRLLKLEIDVFSMITKGLAEKKPKIKILREAKNLVKILSVQIGLDALETNMLWDWVVRTYDKVSKKTFSVLRKLDKKANQEDVKKEERIDAIYSSSRAMIENNSLVQDANKVTWRYEFRCKHEEMFGFGGLLYEAKEHTKSPFFLASSHPKPAKDHAAYEGKLYYDERWEEYVPDEDKPRIRALIRNRRLLTVQYVTGAEAGIFLTLRRNCKHHFMNLPINEVLHSSNKAMLKRHKMYMIEKDRSISRAEMNYRSYYNKVKVEEALSAQIPNETLKKDLNRNKILLDKWKELAYNS